MNGKTRFAFAVLGLALTLGAEEPAPQQKTPAPQKAEAGAKNAKKAKDDPYQELAAFMKVLQIVREKYVDDDRVSYQSLLRGAMRGMMHSLDPFSNYEEPNEFKSTMEDSRGTFPGIGIIVTDRNGLLEVVSVIHGGPADKAGLVPGDAILEVDGTALRGKSMRDAVRMLKGPAGSKVMVRIYRRNGDVKKDFTIERAEIVQHSVLNAGLVDGKIGYFRITNFTATTAADMDAFFRKYAQGKLDGLIIDVRNNPGGLLTSALAVCSRFLERDKLVVSIEGRAEKPQKLYAVDCPKDLETPLVILVNGNSASAAEIFAGCMKDYRRGVVLGSKTFGKGSVQTLLPLPDQGGLRITTAKYYTPSRRVIHGNGIEPDIAAPLSPMAEIEIARTLEVLGEKVPDPRRDPQLQRAIEIVKGIHIFQSGKK